MDRVDEEDLQHILETGGGPSASAPSGPGKHDVHLKECSGKSIEQVCAAGLWSNGFYEQIVYTVNWGFHQDIFSFFETISTFGIISIWVMSR